MTVAVKCHSESRRDSDQGETTSIGAACRTGLSARHPRKKKRKHERRKQRVAFTIQIFNVRRQRSTPQRNGLKNQGAIFGRCLYTHNPPHPLTPPSLSVHAIIGAGREGEQTEREGSFNNDTQINQVLLAWVMHEVWNHWTGGARGGASDVS